MAYVRKFGRPHLFITVTTNLKWPDILESLTPGQQPHDRPDLLVRVFRLKMQNLLKMLKDGCCGCLEALVLNFKGVVNGMHIFFFGYDAKFFLCNYLYHFICVHCPKPSFISTFFFTIILPHTVPKPTGSRASQLMLSNFRKI